VQNRLILEAKMLDLPTPVQQYLQRLIIESRSPAYLLLDGEGHILEWGGNLELYGLSELERGNLVGEHIYFLDGLIPMDESEFFLPTIKTDSDVSADIHIFSAPNHYWILFLDSRTDEDREQALRQKGNELSLLRDKLTKIMDQYLGKDIAQRLAHGEITLEERGERREVTVLFADIRGFTTFSEKVQPDQIFALLNIYLRSMIRPILEESGILDKIIGDAVMAIFGLLPAKHNPGELAFRAAQRMQEGVQEINAARLVENQPILHIGVGIASGMVALGVLGSRDRRSFSAIGHHVNFAARLENKARAGEIMIDGNTYQKLNPQSQSLFSAVTVTLKSFDTPIKVYLHNTGC